MIRINMQTMGVSGIDFYQTVKMISFSSFFNDVIENTLYSATLHLIVASLDNVTFFLNAVINPQPYWK